MYKSRLGEPVELGYIEMDPSSRYGRFREILGKGAMKTVYRAFDEVLGMEVAWNQVKLNDVFQSPDELQRLYSEVHLLNNLDHESIMKFHTSWIDVDRRTFNFITEMFTSGTLREYRQRYKRVDMRAVKNWSRQILRGLAYLHGHSPPVIHRDLKCDNIFVNGHLAQVKIGDLGLAAILKDSNHAHSVIGTPEFMAPELYEEDYDERVDVYSFGMCVLEMLTSEYPYNECSNPAQIYKKVTSGKRPEAFHRIHDGEARLFVGKCLESASKRPSAEELLMDPFLAADDEDEHEAIPDDRNSYVLNGGRTKEVPQISILGDSGSPKRSDMRITGTIDPQDDTIFLKVQISDEDGEGRNIYFPFDISSDTALDVAIEMVKELEIRDWDSLEIAEMIDEQISTLVPTWKCNHCQQHSFGYHYQEEDEYEEDNDDDDDRTHHPFYSLSSHSSSRASLPPALFTSCHDWLQDDDASSESSFGYSNINYCSGNEADFIRQPHNNCTRFCPKEMKMKMDRDCYRHWNDGRDKLTRIQSFVDVRRQLLHRTLVEEINKRRMFKTVGAVENIGFQDPCHGFHRKTRI